MLSLNIPHAIYCHNYIVNRAIHAVVVCCYVLLGLFVLCIYLVNYTLLLISLYIHTQAYMQINYKFNAQTVSHCSNNIICIYLFIRMYVYIPLLTQPAGCFSLVILLLLLLLLFLSRSLVDCICLI